MPSISHAINSFYGNVSWVRKTWWRITGRIDDWLTDRDIYFHWRISDAIHYIKHRIKQSHMIDTKLEKGHWIDKISLMEAALLEMVDDFVSREGEDAFSVVYWDEDDGHAEAKSKMIEILYWKNVRFPALEKEKDDLWDIHHKKYPIVFRSLSKEECADKKLDYEKGFTQLVHENDDPVNREAEFQTIMEKEQFIEAETQRILHLCVDIREYLWT